MRTTILGMACFSIFAFTACEKDNDDSLTNTEIIISHDWHISGATVDPAISFEGIPETNLFPFLQDCNKDDEWEFKADGSFKESRNEPCGGQADHYSGVWSFYEDESKIIIYGDEVSEYDLISLDEDKLVVGTDKGYLGQSGYYYTIEYSK